MKPWPSDRIAVNRNRQPIARMKPPPYLAAIPGVSSKAEAKKSWNVPRRKAPCTTFEPLARRCSRPADGMTFRSRGCAATSARKMNERTPSPQGIAPRVIDSAPPHITAGVTSRTVWMNRRSGTAARSFLIESENLLNVAATQAEDLAGVKNHIQFLLRDIAVGFRHQGQPMNHHHFPLISQ